MQIESFLLGACGGFSLEIVKLYHRYGQDKIEDFNNYVKSWAYVILAISLIFISGFIAAVINSQGSASQFQVVITGIAARSIIREAASAGIANKGPSLGGQQAKIKSTIRHFFL